MPSQDCRKLLAPHCRWPPKTMFLSILVLPALSEGTTTQVHGGVCEVVAIFFLRRRLHFGVMTCVHLDNIPQNCIPSLTSLCFLSQNAFYIGCLYVHTHTHTHTSLGNSTIHIAFLQTSWTLWPSQSTLLWTWTAYCKQYILISPWFCWELGYVKFVFYDMMLRSWKNLNVAKDWICSCPISQQIHYLAHPHDFD